MSTKTIITQLVENYKSVDKQERELPLVIEKHFDPKHQDYNADLLDKLDQRLDFILVGDNPGKEERESKVYFTPKGKAGNAGNYARLFLDMARFYFEEKDGFNYLILNKMPFSTNKTKQLKKSSAIKCAIQHTIGALHALVAAHPQVMVVIVGSSKNNLNKLFYAELAENWANSQLQNNVFFAKHFANGNFFAQYLKHELIGMRDLGGTTFKATLDAISDETTALMDQDYETSFCAHKLLNQCNALIHQHAKNKAENTIVLGTGLLQNAVDLFVARYDYLQPIETLYQQIVDNKLGNKIPQTQALKILINEYQNEVKGKADAVNNKQFETAARHRDYAKLKKKQIAHWLTQNTALTPGLNVIYGLVYIMPSADAFLNSALAEFDALYITAIGCNK